MHLGILFKVPLFYVDHQCIQISSEGEDETFRFADYPSLLS